MISPHRDGHRIVTMPCVPHGLAQVGGSTVMAANDNRPKPPTLFKSSCQFLSEAL
jgi:hypothetical protein